MAPRPGGLCVLLLLGVLALLVGTVTGAARAWARAIADVEDGGL